MDFFLTPVVIGGQCFPTVAMKSFHRIKGPTDPHHAPVYSLGLSASWQELNHLIRLQYFIGKCNSDLAEKLNSHKAEMNGLRTSERVRTAIQWRLEMIIPYMSKPLSVTVLAAPNMSPH